MPSTPINAAEPHKMPHGFRGFMPLQDCKQPTLRQRGAAIGEASGADGSRLDDHDVAYPVATQGEDPMVLASIFDASTAIAIWTRTLEYKRDHGAGNADGPSDVFAAIASYANALITQKTAATSATAVTSSWRLQRVIALDEAHTQLEQIMPDLIGFSQQRRRFIQDIADLMDMLGILMDCRHIGLRLAILQHSMCPRFHTDPILCRLLVTYQGAGTQWLHAEGLGADQRPLAAAQLPDSAISELKPLDVAIIKGVHWQRSIDGAAAWQHPPCWHRSPTCPQPRLLLSLDPIADDEG